MNLADISDLYRYNDWANERIDAAVAPLPQDAFERNVGGSFPSLRDGLSHIIAAEWIWLERWHSRTPDAPPDWVSSSDRSILGAHLREVKERRQAYLSGLSEEDLATTLPYRLLSGAADQQILRDLLVHVVNHSTYHRGQVASMLRQAGSSAPSTDFIVFKREGHDR